MVGAVAPARLARVHVVDGTGRLGLEYVDGGVTIIPVPRPFVGDTKSGLHAVPRQGEFVLVHPEIYGKPNCATSTTDATAKLYPLAPGEVVILHADGRIACKLTNDGVSTILATPSGAQIRVDAHDNMTLTTTGKIDLNAQGGVYVNGQLVLTFVPV